MASASTGRGISRLAALLQSKWPPAIFPSREIAPFGSRMASGQVVRGRMKSIRSIQKITKAMKMVAASKLRGVQVKVEGSRGIPLPFVSLLGDTPDLDATKQIVVCVTSDRGLCGGINSTSVKISKALSKMATAATKDAKYVVIGEKGKSQLLRDSRKQIAMNITETQKVGICFSQVSMMADEILKGLEYDSLKLVFNRFQSVVSFEATVATVLSPELVEKETAMGGKFAYVDNYEIEGEELKLQILQNLSEFSFAAVGSRSFISCTHETVGYLGWLRKLPACSAFNSCFYPSQQLFNALLENTASEMGARMSAMDNSSKNASEMLETLTLSYNRSRQTKITTELIEIISGASALEA